MSPKGVVVVGTDTDAGKTMVSAALVAGLRDAGIPAGYLKPLASECAPGPGGQVSPDVALLHRLVGLKEPLHTLNPVCLRAPLSPLAAAREEGVELSLAASAASCREFMAGQEFGVIEGVGGLLVPIAPGATFRDLAVELSLPVVVAARPGLGTINHTLLTIQALKGAGLAVVGFIFSHTQPADPDDPSIKQNHALIVEYSGTPFMGALPYLGPRDQITGQALNQAVREHLDLTPIMAVR
ncbi:MAG: dethiobiotin synthase [Desulfarculaceae bacterium]|nr:dethiobiotin synthase [Desulfarculaceae bacterium]MCF8047201.1 dethiobiotin synthase [Desulfarculaceae bacterium]MCF8096683.1 dethiobiotin synthase [Desulfarculaceae bacterium]MCF8121314.1 dethiobiotin synthase [Desulfarculaceae bacterium]